REVDQGVRFVLSPGVGHALAGLGLCLSVHFISSRRLRSCAKHRLTINYPEFRLQGADSPNAVVRPPGAPQRARRSPIRPRRRRVEDSARRVWAAKAGRPELNFAERENMTFQYRSELPVASMWITAAPIATPVAPVTVPTGARRA